MDSFRALARFFRVSSSGYLLAPIITTEVIPMIELVHKGCQIQSEYGQKKGAYVGRLVDVGEEVVSKGQSISDIPIALKNTVVTNLISARKMLLSVQNIPMGAHGKFPLEVWPALWQICLLVTTLQGIKCCRNYRIIFYIPTNCIV